MNARMTYTKVWKIIQVMKGYVKALPTDRKRCEHLYERIPSPQWAREQRGAVVLNPKFIFNAERRIVVSKNRLYMMHIN